MLGGRAQYIDGGIEFRDGAGGFDIGVLWGIDFELKAVALRAIPAPFEPPAISDLIWIKVRSPDPTRVKYPHEKGENGTMTDTALLPQKSSIWWIFLLQGFAGIILGLMLVTEPAATVVALTTFLGFYWLILGLLGLVQVFVDRATPWIWSLLSGLVGILAGLLVLRHPLLAALTVPTVIVLILGIEGLAMGVLQIIGAFKGGGAGPFILGAINILVGILLLSSPIAAALAVPIVFGVLLLIQGVGLIILAFRVRSSI